MSKQPLIQYRIQWKPSGNQPGTVRGISAGIGDQLRSLVLLRDHPDPRRLDLRASLRDPFERLYVRDFYLNTALKLIVLLDSSASMGYVGQVNRMHVAKEIGAQLALSAYQSGDAFGLFTANHSLNKQVSLPPKLNRSAWMWVNKHLELLSPVGSSVDGLLKLTQQLPKKRSLVFIVSDFRWSEGKLKQMLKSLTHHDVIPVVLQDPAEHSSMPSSGIATLRDVETGQARFVWLRKGLLTQVVEARQRHIDSIQSICRLYGYRPFVVNGHFESVKLTKYFMERQS